MFDFSPFIKNNGAVRYTYIRDEYRRPIKVIVFSVFYTESTRIIHVGHAPIILSKRIAKINAIDNLINDPIKIDASNVPVGFCKVIHFFLRRVIKWHEQ